MENTEYSVRLDVLIDEFKLETIYLPPEKEVLVTLTEVDRPGLALSGFFGYFKAML